MSGTNDFPRTGEYYHTRRGKFQVLAVKKGMVTIQWQDNWDKLTIEIDDIKSRLIPEQYSGDPDSYNSQGEDKHRIRRPIYEAEEDDDY
jgi:hypothetical protein